MPLLSTIHRANGTTITGRQPSPAIWDDCPWEDIRNGTVNGVHFFDDFADFPLIGTQTTQIGAGKYKLFAGSSGSVAPVDTINSVQIPGGALAFTSGGNNTAGSLAQAYPPFALTGLPSNTGKLWFECCLAVGTILTDTLGFFVGLAETDTFTLSATVPFNAASASLNNSGSAIGFFKGEDALGVVDTVYSDRATSFTNIGASEGSISAAYTFVRLGMKYDPGDPTNTVTFYQNNAKLTSVMSLATLTGCTNLDANNLGLLAAFIGDTSVSIH